MDTARIGIVTASDRASQGVYEDLSGKAIREVLTSYLASPWEAVYRLIPDERAFLDRTLIELCDEERCCEKVLVSNGRCPCHRLSPQASDAVARAIWRPASPHRERRARIIRQSLRAPSGLLRHRPALD